MRARIRWMAAVLCLLMAMGLAGCGGKPEEPAASELVGGTPNTELAMQQGDYIYFDRQDSGLYRLKKDGSELYRLYKAGDLHVLGVMDEYVYYFAPDMPGTYASLERIKLDGTGRQVLAERVNARGGLLLAEGNFYITLEGRDDQTGGLYRIKPDGSERTLVLADVLLTNLKFWNNGIYGINLSDKEQIICLDMGEKVIRQISGTASISRFDIREDKIFYEDRSDWAVYRMNPDGSDLQQMIKNYPLEGETLYRKVTIGNGKARIERVNAEGGPLENIVEVDKGGLKFLLTSDGMIYYANGYAVTSEDGTEKQFDRMYRIKADVDQQPEYILQGHLANYDFVLETAGSVIFQVTEVDEESGTALAAGQFYRLNMQDLSVTRLEIQGDN